MCPVRLDMHMLVGPVVAIGVYAVSAQLTRGEKPSLRRCLIYGCSPVATVTVLSCSTCAKCAMISSMADGLRTRAFVRRRPSLALSHSNRFPKRSISSRDPRNALL